MKTIPSLLEGNEKKEFKYYKELRLDRYAYESFVDSNFEWACDECLRSKKAVLANPHLQNHSATSHLAYSDSKFTCDNCWVEFVFTKNEKRLWYEKLKFWIDSRPVNCPDCRKEIRQLKIENKSLSDVLRRKASDPGSDEL